MKHTKIFRTLICTTLMLCCLFDFSSCAVNQSNIDDIFSQLIISDENETKMPAFTEHIYVIIPNGCSGELSVKVRELAEGIKARTGILTSLKYDNELTVVPKNTCEVLVGNTNRLVSENALDVLRKDEYLCHWDNGAIVICGRNDASTILAIEKFILDVLPLASDQSLMPSDFSFENKLDYEIEQIMLNGYDLYDYVLLYQNNNQCREKEIAFMIRNFINAKSGYYLDVIADSDVSNRTGRIISLCGMGDENAIVPYKNGISLEAKDSYSLSLVAARFIDSFEEYKESGKINLKYDDVIEVQSVDTTFESVFYLLKENKEAPFAPVYNVISLLKSNQVGICFIGNPNDNLRSDFELNIKEPIITQELTVGERKIMIAYNSQIINKMDVSVAPSGNYLLAEVETVFGEKISYIYIMNGEIPEIKRNTVIFCENNGEVKCEDVSCITSGAYELDNNNRSYFLGSDENISVENSGKIVVEDKNRFSCTLKTKIVYSEDFLNYTLK